MTLASAPLASNPLATFESSTMGASVSVTCSVSATLSEFRLEANVTNIIDNLDGTYTLEGTFPRTTEKLYSSGDNAIKVTVDAESTTTATDRDWLPATGWQYVDVTTPDPTSEIVAQYAAGPILTGYQGIIKSTTNEDAVDITLEPDLNYTFGPYAGATDQTTEFYARDASGNALAEEVIVFDFADFLEVVLEDVTSISTGEVKILGDTSLTLQNVISSISGSFSTSGNLVNPLGDTTSLTNGSITVTGGLNRPLDNIIMIAGGGNVGFIAGELFNTTSSVSGSIINQGSTSTNLTNTTLNITTVLKVTGESSTNIQGTISIVNGKVTVEGDLLEALEDTTMFTGALNPGSINVNVGGSFSSIIGEIVVTGDINQTFDVTTSDISSTLSINGTSSSVVTDVTMLSENGKVISQGEINSLLEDITLRSLSVPEVLTILKYLVYLSETQRKL